MATDHNTAKALLYTIIEDWPGKVCRVCGEEKPLEAFSNEGQGSLCKTCASNAAKRHAAERRDHFRQHPEDRTTVTEKTCTRCGEVLPASLFYRLASSPDGLTGQCRRCRNDDLARYRDAHREEIRRKDRDKKRGTEDNKRRCREYREQDLVREQLRYQRWYQERGGKEQRAQYQRDNAGAMRVYRARSNRKHRLKRAAAHKRWVQANPERWAAKCHNRRARERGAEGFFTGADIVRLYSEQQGLCYYCQTPLHGKYDVDHKTPLSRGGTNWPDNICCACDHCNSRKNSKTEEEFIAFLAFEANWHNDKSQEVG